MINGSTDQRINVYTTRTRVVRSRIGNKATTLGDRRQLDVNLQFFTCVFYPSSDGTYLSDIPFRGRSPHPPTSPRRRTAIETSRREESFRASPEPALSACSDWPGILLFVVCAATEHIFLPPHCHVGSTARV